MRRTVGVLVMEHIAVGLVEGHKVVGPLNIYPEKSQMLDPLQSMPAEGIVDCIRRQVEKVARGEKIEADRKSTRLNSSHRCISYAVFCLKKKKKQITNIASK